LIDFDHMWLPEPLCRWGVLVGLAISATAGVPVFVQHLIAAVLALLALEALSALAERVWWGSQRLALATPNSLPWEGPGLV
jgi:leader peptidase (prepilin peptidase)/N-methyltransferase